MLEFKIKGITVRFTFLFFAVMTVFLLMDTSGLSFWGFVAAIIHECGHIIMFLLLGNKPKKIAFEVSGISILKENTYTAYWKDILIIMAGPCTNLLMAFLLLHNNPYSINGFLHLGVGCFNLLPIKVLDGGELLMLLLSIKYDSVRAERIVLFISYVIIIPILAAGLFIALSDSHNLTLVVTGIYLLISMLK